MNRKRLIRIGAIVAVAGATGFVMQAQDKAPAPQRTAALAPQPPAPATASTLPVTRVVATAAVLPAAMPAAPAAQSAAFEQETPPVQGAAPEPAPALATPEARQCSEDMALLPQPGAMLDLGLLAPCRPNQRVLIRHGGLVITGQTSAAGSLIASIPAFQSPARVTLGFADGTEVSETVDVADLGRFDRFAVQWMADDSFQLHAFETGAGYGDAGHIHAAAPRKPGATGGFLSVIGDAAADRPLLAQVFTWPADTAALSQTVALTLEAEVTAATCDREILGETLQFTGGKLTVRDLALAMPDCGATGEFVALPDPLLHERLAAR